jgi:hypothetical protein
MMRDVDRFAIKDVTIGILGFLSAALFRAAELHLARNDRRGSDF